MMIAAVNPVQESDAFTRPVGQPQTERARVELNCFLDVAGKEEDMGEAPGRDARNATPERAPRTPGPPETSKKSDFSLGDDLAATLISTRLPS